MAHGQIDTGLASNFRSALLSGNIPVGSPQRLGPIPFAEWRTTIRFSDQTALRGDESRWTYARRGTCSSLATAAIFRLLG